MTIVFDPSGTLNVAADPSDLPETGDGRNASSDALTRCKNLRINQKGKAITRDGSTKLNATAINTAVWWIEEQGGVRYTFAGTVIYRDETSIATGLTSAQWAAVKYNAFNDTTQQVFALNGTDRKRIEASSVYEWGIAAPTVAPILTAGPPEGSLTGRYNAKYTYLRKVGSVVVAESNPSPSADDYVTLEGQTLLVDVAAPSDAQVTHIRLYRTDDAGVLYYRDQDVPVSNYAYGYSEDFEADDAYIAGNGFKFTITDSTHGTENTFTWESVFESSDQVDGSGYGGNEWWNEYPEYYQQWLAWMLSQGHTLS